MIMFGTACANLGLYSEVSKTAAMFAALESSVVTEYRAENVVTTLRRVLRDEGGTGKGYYIAHKDKCTSGKIELRHKDNPVPIAFAYYQDIEHIYDCRNDQLVDNLNKYEKFAKKGGRA